MSGKQSVCSHPDGDEETEEEVEERKRARRERVLLLGEKNRNESALPPSPKNDGHENGGGFSSSSSSRQRGATSTGSSAESQIANSRSRLDRQKRIGLAAVTEIRIDAEGRESVRREGEARCRRERLELLERDEQATTSCGIRREIAEGWDRLTGSSVVAAQELRADIDEQRRRCSNLLETRSELIAEFRLHRRQKDEEYVSSIGDQTDRVDSLKGIMNVELDEIRRCYDEEMNCIEEAIAADRCDLIEGNRERLTQLMNEKCSMEGRFLEAKQARREECRSDVVEARRRGAGEHAALKDRLELQVQELERQLEETRTAYQLNADRLEYNLRVLTERSGENIDVIQRQKKRHVKVKEDLNADREAQWTAEARERDRIDCLTEHCRKLDDKCDRLGGKLRRFRTADEQRYRALLDMHVDELSVSARQLRASEGRIASMGLGVGPSSSSASPPAESAPPPREATLINLSKEVIPDSVLSSWVQLEKLMMRYNDLLDDQSDEAKVAEGIARENRELQRALDEHRGDKINEELLYPPASLQRTY